MLSYCCAVLWYISIEFFFTHVISWYSYAEALGFGVDAVANLKKLFSFAEQYGYADWICFDASVVRGLADLHPWYLSYQFLPSDFNDLRCTWLIWIYVADFEFWILNICSRFVAFGWYEALGVHLYPSWYVALGCALVSWFICKLGWYVALVSCHLVDIVILWYEVMGLHLVILTVLWSRMEKKRLN